MSETAAACATPTHRFHTNRCPGPEACRIAPLLLAQSLCDAPSQAVASGMSAGHECHILIKAYAALLDNYLSAASWKVAIHTPRHYIMPSYTRSDLLVDRQTVRSALGVWQIVTTH